MKRITRRITTVMLAAILLLSLCAPAFAGVKQGNFEDNPTVDFVLVLDCSGSMLMTDPDKLCNAACKMFLDMLPMENARIAIVGFGNREGRPYALQSLPKADTPKDVREAVENLDMSRVCVYLPLTNVADLQGSSVESIKREVDEALAKQGDHSPMGAAVTAAVDLLENSGATEGNACIIVLSDGVNDDYRSKYWDELSSTEAAKWAGAHSWPMYTLQLNKDNQLARDTKGTQDGARAIPRMQEMALSSGAGGEEEGHYNLTDFSSGTTGVAKAFIKIFNRFMGNGGNIEESKTDGNGDLRKAFQVESLTSEMTVVAAGSGIYDIRLIDPNGKELDPKNGDYVLTVEEGRYMSAKLICPAPGEWTAVIKGDKNASLVMYQCSMRDMDMLLSSSVADLTAVIAKDKKLYFEIAFQYHGRPAPANQEYFKQVDAVLIAENLNTGASYEITDLTPTAGGYTKELLMADLLAMDGVSDGVYRFYARIVDDMFRGGMKVSNSLEPFKTVNAPVTLKSTQLTDMEGFVFQPVDKEQRIDLNAFIDNPDGDQLIYDLVCVSDRNYKVNWLIDKDDYLYITDCGDQTGEFMLELSVREPNGEPKTFAPFKLTVREHMIQYSSIPKVLIMSKPMSFQHAPEEAERIMPEAAGAGAKKHDKTLPGKTAEIPLEAFYFDGDGQAPVFSDFSFGALNGDAYRAEFDEATQTLRIFALGKGKDTLSFKVSDGFSTRTAQVEVEVITGKDEFIKTLIPYWWVLIVLAVIIFALIAAAALTRVKGNWDIKLELSNGDYAMGTFDIRHFTRSGKKKKFLLKELLLNNGLLNQMEVAERTQGSIDALLPGFFGPTTGADKIGMKGVLFGKGCTFYGLPANNAVTTVSVNGMIPRKKAVFKAGETVIDIAPPDDQSYNTLRITLDLH